MPEIELKKWFLGPTGENVALLQELTRTVVDRAAQWRQRGGAPPAASTPKDDPLEQRVAQLLDYLEQRTVPAYSSRYQAHMGWDLMLPGVIGQLIAMLFPSNNVAYEGSPGTTVLEMLVARDLCRMLGYEADPDPKGIKPWGHLVGGGTIGNIEALWAARNLKFLPLALKATLALTTKKTKEIRFPLTEPLSLKLGASDVKFDDLNAWQLLNIPIDESLALPARAAKLLKGVDPQAFENELNAQSLNQKGIHHFVRNGVAPKILLSHDNHYSLEKAVALLGLGQDSLDFVRVDDFGRMKLDELERKLRTHSSEGIPVLAVVANLGSTELGAVDTLSRIVMLRDEFRRNGLEFMVHVDAAFGGYHASLLRENFDLDWAVSGAAGGGTALRAPSVRSKDAVPEIGLSDYVAEQYGALPKADSIAVDPHKLGFLPYPGGAICYRNSALRDLTKFSAPYLGAIVPQGIGQIEERTDQFMGVFGVEGSRTGGSAAAAFLAHSLLRPSKSGYGQLSRKELYASKRVFAALFSMGQASPQFSVAVAGTYPEAKEEDALRAIAEKDDEKLTDSELELLRSCGPDLNLLCYLFNFKRGDNTWNDDPLWLNVFNLIIYDSLKLKPETARGAEQRLIVSQTIFAGREGTDFIRRMLKRLGIEAVGGLDNAELFALRSAEWNPWLTESDPKLTSFTKALSAAANDALPGVIAARQFEAGVPGLRKRGLGDLAIALGIGGALALQARGTPLSDKTAEAPIIDGLMMVQQGMALPGLTETALAHFARAP